MIQKNSGLSLPPTGQVRTRTQAPAGLIADSESMESLISSESPDALGLYSSAPDERMSVLRGTLLTLVRRDGRDLTARQLTAFLTVYMEEEVHTVSSLAELMNISRPGVTRIMDRLVQFDLVAREEDREDRRRVLVRRTARGMSFYRDLVSITRAVASEQTGPVT